MLNEIFERNIKENSLKFHVGITRYIGLDDKSELDDLRRVKNCVNSTKNIKCHYHAKS